MQTEYELAAVSRITGLPRPKLLFWAREFPRLEALTRRADDELYFAAEALELVLRIDLLLDKMGYKLSAARRLIAADASAEVDVSGGERRERLHRLRGELLQVRQTLLPED